MPLFYSRDTIRHICVIPGVVFCSLLTLLMMVHSADAGLSNTTLLSGGIALAAQPPTKLQAHSCPNAVKAPSYWSTLVGTQEGVSHVEHVLCNKLLGDASQQALITVRHNGNAVLLDVYVYTHISNPHPTLLFSTKGLPKGDATISAYTTVLIGEADRLALINQGKTDQQLTQDLYREFRWSSTEKRFAQITFPGMFPDMTRYQAEIDQQKIKHGLDLWKRNATDVAVAAARQFFAWKRTTTTNITSGGGASDMAATIRVTQAPAPSTAIPESTVMMQLSRLEGRAGNIWEVTAIKSNGTLKLTSPPNGSKVFSPLHITGSGSSFEGIVGMAFVLDHLSLEIGHASASGKGDSFQADVKYRSTVNDPVHEEGIVAVFSLSAADGSVSTAVMEKVLL